MRGIESFKLMATEGAFVVDLGLTIMNGQFGDAEDEAISDFARFYPQVALWLRNHRVRLSSHENFLVQHVQHRGLCVVAKRAAPLRKFIKQWSGLLISSAVLFRRRERGLPLTILSRDDFVRHLIMPRITDLCPFGFELKGDWQGRAAVKDQLREWLVDTETRGPIIVFGETVHFHAEQDLIHARLAGVLNT